MPTLVAPVPASVVFDRGHSMAWRVMTLALPVLAQQLLVLIVNLSDRYLAGHLVVADRTMQAAYQAAQTSANYLTWFVSSYTVLVSVGATAVVARCVGAGDRPAALRATHQALLLAVLAGLFGTLLGLTLTDVLIAGLSLHGEAARFAAEYLRPMFWLLPFQVLEVAGVACLVGAGDTRTGLAVQVGVALLNLPLAWVFCYGIGSWPGIGFVGISLGTALCYVVAATAVVSVLFVGRAGLQIRLPGFVPDPATLARLLRVSIPAALDSMSVVAGQFWFLRIVNNLGDVAAAAHGTALGWEALGFQTSYAFGVAAMTLVGQNLGARRPAEATHAGWTAFGLGCAATCCMGLIFYTFAPQMAGFFNESKEQAAIVAAAVPVLRLVALATPALACTIIFTQALRGAGDTRVPVLFTWFGFLLVRIPLAYWLTSESMGFGLMGAWLAMCADLVVRGLFFLARFAGGKWRLAKV